MPNSPAQKLARKENRLRKRELVLERRRERNQRLLSFQELDDVIAVLEKSNQDAINRVVAGISLGSSL